MKIEVQETGAAQQQPVALLQIVLMNVLKADSERCAEIPSKLLQLRLPTLQSL